MNMADHSSGSRTFMQVYNSLPPEARESLVEKQLSTLLDSAPQKSYDKVLRAATTLKTKYAAAPTLDLKGKQKEINGLIDELVRDSKRAIVCERSHRDELLSEIVESIVGWLNDIWSVVYEYNVHFQEAHRCLVYLSEVLDALNDAPGTGGQCKCPLEFNALQVTIRKKGKIIKTFSLQGPRNLDRVLLWIWRDLFVSMFAKDIHTDRIPDMLRDIEECMNWKALERLLYGGASARSLFREDADDDEYDFDDDNDQVCQDDDNDDGEGDEPGSGSWRCRCKYHANHWNKHANEQRNELRDLVTEHLQNLFELAPSLKLFTSIVAISPDRELTEMDLFDTISNIAGASADALVAALEIHGSQGQAADLMSLLEEHAHLLRPRDASVYQAAVAVLSEFHGYHEQALELAEKELLDAAAGVRMGIKTAFSQIDDPTSVAALSEILKLRPDHLTRSQRVETWVEKALTPGSQPANPMAFAAMLMGFPFAGSFDESDDAEVLGYLDMDSRDPDLADLREEFRPRLRDRFEGWTSVIRDMKGGNVLLTRVYLKIVEDMPLFRVNDIAEEMLNRLGERPHKAHISDAIEALQAFCKTQRRKIAARAERKRRSEAKKAAPVGPRSRKHDEYVDMPELSPTDRGPEPGSSSWAGGLNDVD